MNDLTITVGLVGSLASIISLFIAAPGWKSKFLHLAYALVITIIATMAFEYKNDRKIAQLELENKGVRSTLLTNQAFSLRSEMGSALDMGQIEGSNLLLIH